MLPLASAFCQVSERFDHKVVVLTAVSLESLKSWHGLLLWTLFVVVALTQYFLNGQFATDALASVH